MGLLDILGAHSVDIAHIGSDYAIVRSHWTNVRTCESGCDLVRVDRTNVYEWLEY